MAELRATDLVGKISDLKKQIKSGSIILQDADADKKIIYSFNFSNLRYCKLICYNPRPHGQKLIDELTINLGERFLTDIYESEERLSGLTIEFIDPLLTITNSRGIVIFCEPLPEPKELEFILNTYSDSSAQFVLYYYQVI